MNGSAIWWIFYFILNLNHVQTKIVARVALQFWLLAPIKAYLSYILLDV